MGSRTYFSQLNTAKPIEEVMQAAKSAFRSVGGTMQETPSGLWIRQGTNGVSFAFSADMNAYVNVRQIKEDRYEVECQVRWGLNALSWVCLVVGFFIFGILWIVPLLFLFINPDNAYQQALYRIQTYLD